MQKKAQSQIENTGTVRTESEENVEDLLSDLVTAVKGMSGTKIYDWILGEEYNTALAGQKGMEVFEKMRRSDAQVSAVLLAMELPIRNAYWFVEPAKDEDDEVTPEAEEHARFVSDNLFEKMRDGWDNKLREILTELPFGFSLFEKTYISDGEKVYLDKLGFRKQTTIMQWMTQDRTPGVLQQLPTPGPGGLYEANIPGVNLLLFSFRKEGDNYQGISVLRSCYKNYFIKDKLYKFDAVKHERQGVGIPVIYIPKSATKPQKAVAANIVKNIRSTEQTGIVMPGSKDDGWEFEFADLKAGSQSDLWESIKHHNREIAKNVLAQFLELGDTGGSGSYSLGADQSDLFVSGLTAIANQIADVINEYLVKELIDLNFDTDRYPKLRCQKITKTDVAKLAETLTALSGGGIIKTDESIEDYMRDLMGLPARDIDAIAEWEDPIDGEAPEDGEETPPGDGTDELLSELDDLAKVEATEEYTEEEIMAVFSEVAEGLFDSMEDACEFAGRGGHLSDEHKKKISEALKGRGGKDLQDTVEKNRSAASKTLDAKRSVSDQFDKEIEKVKNEVSKLKSGLANIPKGAKGKLVRQGIANKAKELAAKIREIRGNKKGNMTALSVIRMKQLWTAAEARKIIAARKKALRAEIKGIRESVKAGRMSAKDAIASLGQGITANKTNIANLRDELKGLPRNDPRREGISQAIEWLQKESLDIRVAQSGIRTSAKQVADTATKVIEKKKTDSQLYHDHDEESDLLPSAFNDVFFMDMSRAFSNDRITQLIRGAKDETSRIALRKLGFKFNDYEDKAARPLTFAEKKVNLSALIAAMDEYTLKAEGAIDEITAKQKADLLKQVSDAVKDNDIKTIGTIKAKHTGEMAKALEEIMKDVFEIGKKAAASEMGVQVIGTSNEVKAAIKVQAQAVVDKVTAEIENGVKTAVTQAVQKNGGSVTATGASEAVAAASANLDKAIEGAKATITSLGVTGTINMGRAFVFERFPEKVYAFQFSAILDARTTDTCRSLDGRIVKPGSPEFYDYSPPRHYRCRSIWVEILQDEVFKPAIDWIPSSIPKNPTIDTFKDLKAPIILQGSPAVKVVQQELEERKQKLADLEELGQYPNRQAAHKTRIAELEKALKGIKKSDDAEFFEKAKQGLSGHGVEFA